MEYRENMAVPAAEIAGLRRSVGWNGMEACYNDPRLVSYFHVACYDGEKIHTITVAFEERLLSFYERFGFHTGMLCGQMETYDTNLN